MMQYWYEDMIRFMKDASEYGTYNQELTRLMEPYLKGTRHICDAGCGLGYLSLAMAPFVGQVSSVEKNPGASAVLADNCKRFGITNVRPVCGEVAMVPPAEKYDAMVFCFFGGIWEILSVAKEQCDGTVFIITRNYTTHRFSVGKHSTGNYGYHSANRVLKELNIPFEETFLDLEFGQPFRNLRDARRFFELYSKDQETSMVTEEFLKSKLVETGREDFPWYSPHQRQIAFLHFSVNDIPDHIG